MPAIWQHDRRQRDRGLQRPERHPVRHAPRRRGEAPWRADQGRARHLRRSAPAGLRDERARAAETRSCARYASTARNGCFSRRSRRDVAIIRATTADERGNLSYEHEGAFLGGLDQALAARNNGGIVIAQVKRVVQGRLAQAAGRARAGHAGRLCRRRSRPDADHADGLRPGDQRRDLAAARRPSSSRVRIPRSHRAAGRAWSSQTGSAVNLGFGISANVPRILLEEGLHGAGHLGHRARRGRRRAAARTSPSAARPTPMRSCRRPNQFTYFQGGGFDVALLSFLQIDARRQRQRLQARLQALPDRRLRRLRRHHGAARKRIVFSGFFTAGAKLEVGDGRLTIVQGRQAAEVRRSGRARHVQRRMARQRAGQRHHLCHRALRHRTARRRPGGAPRSRRASTCSATCSTRPNFRCGRRDLQDDGRRRCSAMRRSACSSAATSARRG